jgi:Domain of unknown function (DUF4157)
MQAGRLKTGLTSQADTASPCVFLARGLLQHKFQCKAAQATEAAAGSPLVPKALHAPGQPIEAETRKFMKWRIGHNFGQIPVAAQAARSNVLQIGSPSDSLEQEADRVADSVTQMWSGDEVDFPVHQDAVPKTVRRTTRSPYSLSEGKILEEDEEQIQAKAAVGEAGAVGPAISDKVESVVQRPGVALPDATRAFMESRLGYDFSRVRIHADGLADEAAQSVHARAFTKGASLVFAGGQYSPDSQSGRWLLAHELAHVVQQGNASARAARGSLIGAFEVSPTIGYQDRSQTLRRVKWNTARDTGRDSLPWGTGPRGDVYEVQTDAGTKISAWKPHDGSTYWCHGYTFGGSSAAGGPFSIWGQSVPTVLRDDGWQNAFTCVGQERDILVFAQNNVAHSGIVHSVFEPGGIVDENTSMLDSKWGQAAQNRSSWKTNAGQYGRYQVFSKQPAAGPCAGKGANER